MNAANTGAGGSTLIAGGRFYGESAQEVAGGIAHYIPDGGMRLQFLGAGAGGQTVGTATGTVAQGVHPLPEPELPAVVLPSLQISYPPWSPPPSPRRNAS